MPVLAKIKDTMKKQKIADEIMAQMDFEADSNDPKNVIAVIDKMDELFGFTNILRLLCRTLPISLSKRLGC